MSDEGGEELDQNSCSAIDEQYAALDAGLDGSSGCVLEVAAIDKDSNEMLVGVKFGV